MKTTKTIQGNDYPAVFVESFDVLVDPKPRFPAKPVIGLMVHPFEGDGQTFIMPIEFNAAKAVADCILRTLLSAAPELFY
jgi:hypothetical protein